MAITIFWKDDPDRILAEFADEDPLYWFLYPYFEEAYREIGQMVDLQGRAVFFAEELLALFLILEHAECDVRSRGDQWHVTVGLRGNDGPPIRKLLTKSEALDRIDAVKELLNDAFNTGQEVVFNGD